MASLLRTGYANTNPNKDHLVLDGVALCGVAVVVTREHDTVRKAWDYATCKNCRKALTADTKRAYYIRKFIDFGKEVS